MPSTRSSARIANKSDPASSPARDETSSRKRKASGSAAAPGSAKKGKKATPKKQATIEQTMDIEKDDGDDQDEEMRDNGDEGVAEAEPETANGEETKDANAPAEEATTTAEKSENGVAEPSKDEEPSEEAKEGGESTGAEADKSAEEQSKEEGTKPAEELKTEAGEKANGTNHEATTNGDFATTTSTSGKDDATNGNNAAATTSTSSMDETGKVSQETEHKEAADSTTAANGEGVQESKERAEAVPSSVLEKGLIYFFYRASVASADDQAHALTDIARSYIVLRPLPNSAEITSGALPDQKNNRLLALPKKVIPKSGRDRFMVFVEKAGATIQELKEDFMKGSDYDTKTTGTRHAPAVTPVGEGVYAITSTGRASHLAYMLTLPEELGEVQEGMGLSKQGSFVTSVKNPEQKGPANASLPQGPDWPKEFQEEFRGLRWMPVQPKHLDYANAQVLIIGESGGLDKASEAKDEKEDGKETAAEELEAMEGEDHERVEGLKGDDAIFADLKTDHEQYHGLQTTW